MSGVLAIAAAAAMDPLVLTKRIDGPWLAIRNTDHASASSVVLVDPDQNSWGRYIDIDAESFRAPFPVSERGLIALAEFGIICSLYPHSRVISFRKERLSRRAWADQRVSRLRVSRNLWDRVAEAAKQSNIELTGAARA